MKPFRITKAVLIFFLFMVSYAMITPDTTKLPEDYKFLVYERVFYSLVMYGMMIFWAVIILPKIYNSIDIFSTYFFIVYCAFKFIMFSLLLNKDIPTYAEILNSKPIVLILSLSILVFTFALMKLKK